MIPLHKNLQKPNRLRYPFIKIRAKGSPIDTFIKEQMSDRKIYFNNVFEAERLLNNVFRYKSLTSTGLKNLEKIKSALREASKTYEKAEDEYDLKVGIKAKELIAKIENFEKSLK